MALLGERELQRMARTVLGAVAADQAEVLIYSGTSSLTRFANNYIHQNVEETDTNVHVRAVIGKKIGVAATDVVTDEGLRAVAERAVALARLQQDNEDFISLPGPTPITPVSAFDERTASFGPDERAEVVREIDGAALAEEAIDKCLRGAGPQPLEPGAYDVILEEYAVADFMDYFAYLAFGAQAFLEQRSFMSGHLGEKLMGENISLWDDGLSLEGIPAPFDAEGVAKQRVDFIKNGVAVDVVWDSYYGGQAGRPSTGHALPAGNTEGPLPSNMFLGTGNATKDDMIASTERGVLVTRFWYTRPVHPLTVVMTGMTRDGTFLIENGRIVRPVRNLRFTQSYLEAMNQVEALGRDSKLLTTFTGTCRVPALKIKGWNFNQGVEYSGPVP
jgi:predicted Zn-dependent protease